MKGTKHIYMKYYSKKQWTQKLTVMVFLAMALGGTAVQAMPSGADIRSGQGSISQDGKNMTVQQNSQRMAIDWTKFDIAKDETVRYAQPDRNAISLNRVTGGQQSVIAGNLNANGNVVLVNPNGVVFTKNSSVDVGGLVASTARLNDEAMKNFSNGKDSLGLSLDKDSTASVINEGQIKAQGGLVALHAANVENKGTITNEGGTLAMAAAKNLTLSAADDDKLNFTVDGELAKSQALNSGSLKADGGYVVMTAKSAGDVLSTVVNNTGTIEAKTLRKNEKGQILLDGGDNGQVEVSGTLDASGTEDGQSAGNIKVIGEKTIVHDGTNLLARGNVDGGKIETSGDVLNLGDNLNIDAKGVNGKAGEWLLDPLEVLIQDDEPTLSNKDQTHGTVNEGSETQINYNDPPSETQNADATYSSTSWIKTKLITDILNKGTDVTIQAASTSQAASITVNSAINPTVAGDGEATLALEAQRNITINKEIKASGGKLNVKLNSDTDGDGVGAVIINADISTNGGTFTSGSGGNVKFTAPSGTKAGAYAATGIVKDTKPNIAGHTVGTYFGYIVPEGQSAIELSGEKNNRNITTNGGAITLDGEVAIGLNGGVLTLDTSKKDGTAGGNVNITGIINSGNSYDTYIYGTEKWNQLVKKLVQEYMDHNTVPSYRFVGINYTKNTDGTYSYTTQAKHFDKGESHYAFHELNPKDVNGANWTYTNSDATLDTQHTRWYATTKAGDGYNSFIMEGTTPETSQMSIDDWLIYYRRTEPDNYAKKYANGNKDTNSNLVTYEKIQNDPTKMATLESDISALIAHNWFASESLANPGDKSGANPGDSYLATITTALENSLSTPNSQKTLWVGGMGSGVRNKTNDKTTNPYSQYPADPSHQDGFYWVTGPEGLVTTTVTNADGTTTTIKGTKFWDTSKSYWNKDLKKSNYGEQVYGYTKWSSWSGGGQPDNSAPFLTVGYGNNNAWDDAAIDGGTTVGFVQETNLYNSSLNIKTDGGKVTLQGDLGKSVGLDTVKIDAGSGSVTTGNTTNAATEYNHGTIYADHGVYINGGEITVGGEIHSGGTDVEATRNADASFKEYLDNVTIKSAGNLTVHGVESDGYTDSDGNLKGGKISLTSTGDIGKITLGAGVDYNGKATEGTLAAASTAEGAVVIDAQGSQGSLVNSTTGTNAITTGDKGTWQVYVNSPSDYGTVLGDNLKSGTNAQWTAKSDANTTVKTNSSNNNLTNYTDTSSNKFIFQVTPVITISGGYTSKTYGDTLAEEKMAETLTSKAIYRDSKGSDIDVTGFKKNFDESNYLDYVTSSNSTKKGLSTVNVSSDGTAKTATRTNGNEKAEGSDAYKTATDDKRAFYVMDVTYQDDVKTLNGYDKAANPGEVEITRKTLTINTDATQTYGNADVTSGKPADYSTQLVNGDKLDAGDITYTIATVGTYAANKGSNTTAHAGTYENQYLTTGAGVKASDGSDASANYEVTGRGTLTVNPADLYLTVGNVSTTYGTAFDDTKYGYTVDSAKGGLVNGDTQDAVLGEKFLNYTNTGAKTDASNENVKTQNAGIYELQGAASKDLSDYTVHITNGKSTVEKAKLTLTVGDTSTTYGTSDWTPYTYTLSGNTNGDLENDVRNHQIEVSYSNGGEKSDPNNSAVKTQNAGDYGLTGKFTLKGDTAKNYEIDEVNSDLTGKATVKKATVKVKLNDVSTTYGTAFDTSKYGYDTSSIEGLTNGDGSGVVTSALDGTYGTGDITYTNTGDASSEEQKTGKVTKTVNGGPYYLEGSTNQTLDNYNIEIENGNATINKATLHLSTGDYTEDYGDAGAVQKDLNRATTVTGEKNGDNLADLASEIGIHNTSGALLSDARTNDVKYKADGSLDSYDIATDFKKSLDNYDVVLDKTGTVTLTPVEITVDNEMVQTYGSQDRSFKEVVDHGFVNGDKISTDGLKMAPKANGNYETNKGNRTTADAGTYKDDLAFSGGGIVHEDGTTNASKNYKVTIKGDIIVNKADLTVNTDDILTYYGVVKNTQSRVTGLTNGDQADGIQYGYGDYGHGYLNGNTTTNMPGNYAFGTSLSGPDFLKNYNIIGGNANLQIIQSKPDQTTHYVEGAHRPQDKLESALPVFRVDASGVVKQYGTYGIESQSQAVTLSPTGMRMPEPNQTSTQDRKYLTTLKTAHGHGTFRLEYNGVVLRVIPVDPAAEQIVEAGDKLKNVALSEQALHAAYTQMGLDLVNLKGVYIYMAPM